MAICGLLSCPGSYPPRGLAPKVRTAQFCGFHHDRGPSYNVARLTSPLAGSLS
jgi:hypothetical protein